MLHRTMPDVFTQPHRAGGFRDTAFFRPEAVVLVAAEGSAEAPVLARNLAAGGFRGRLLAVGAQPEGFEAAASIAALPVAPDLAVLCLPPDALEGAMAGLAARGCFAAIVPGPAPDLAAMAARSGMRALGQGSFGIAIPAIGLNATLSHVAPARGRLALVTQSSAIARAVLDWAAADSVGFSHVVGIGGNNDYGFAGVLDWLSRDPGTGAILLDLRRIKNRRMFVSAARAAAHLVKGAAANMCALRVNALAHKIERACTGGDPAKARRSLPELDRAWRAFIAHPAVISCLGSASLR